MVDTNLGVVEAHFADIIWKNEPIHSRELAKLCAEELNWKRPTTYNVLRKLCGKGIFQNSDGMVSSKISRQDFYSIQGEHFWRRPSMVRFLHLWQLLQQGKSCRILK